MITKELLQKLIVPETMQLHEVIKMIDAGAKKIVFVINNENKFIGTLTDGDIRRWIIATGGLEGKALDICNKKAVTATEDYEINQIKAIMLQKNIEAVPVIQHDQVIDVLFWENLFTESPQKTLFKTKIPVIIMAGGRGTRLDPFTRVLPKPLIPIGDRPIIELIISRFLEHGLDRFYISINHKARTIKAYFEDVNPAYSVEFFEEDKPLGTIGSLKIIENDISGPVFVTNCDIIVQADYHEIYQFHIREKNDITVVTSLKNYDIPYGICDIGNGGSLKALREKPAYRFLVNTGLYILNASVLEQIPDGTFFNITELINKVNAQKGKVRVFPISEKSWIDIGEWEEYKKAIKILTV